MSNFLEDGISTMMGSLLAKAGIQVTYVRSPYQQTLTMRKSRQPPLLVDNGNGQMVEIMITDFLIDPTIAAFQTFNPPQPGDTIQLSGPDGEIYSVQHPTGDKVFKQAADSMMRIHTKRVQ